MNQGFAQQGGYLPQPMQPQGVMQMGPMGQPVFLMPVQQMNIEQPHHVFENNNLVQVLDPNTGAVHLVQRDPMQAQAQAQANALGFGGNQFLGQQFDQNSICYQSQAMLPGIT